MTTKIKRTTDTLGAIKTGGFDMPELRQNDTIIRTKRIEATLRRLAKQDLSVIDQLLIER
jgi:hypothetical protein